MIYVLNSGHIFDVITNIHIQTNMNVNDIRFMSAFIIAFFKSVSSCLCLPAYKKK